MKLTNILLEVFDKPYSWNQIKNDSDWKRYTFKTESDVIYAVRIEEGVHGVWDISFVAQVGNKSTIYRTNTGDSVRVFATVMDILKSFLKTTYVKKIIFTADTTDGSSRSRLYTALVNRYASEAGFDVDSIRTAGDDIIYTLSNKKKPALNEVFNQPYSWSKIADDNQHKGYEFKTSAGLKYRVSIGKEDESAWVVNFSSYTRGGGFSYDKTGTGDSIRVFATVLDIIKSFIRNNRVEAIVFVADGEDGPSRRRLYTALVNRYASESGFKVVSIHPSDVDTTEYTLKPKAKLNEMFDRPYSWSKLSSRADGAIYGFSTDGGVVYEVEFGQYTEGPRKGSVDVAFGARLPRQTRFSYDKTDTGDSIRVFSTVLEIMREYLRSRWVKELTFSASEFDPKRQSLYKRLVDKYAGGMGFRLVKMHMIPIGGLEFVLKNTRPKK